MCSPFMKKTHEIPTTTSNKDAGARRSDTASRCEDSNPEEQGTSTNCTVTPGLRTRVVPDHQVGKTTQGARGPSTTWASPLHIAAKSKSANAGKAYASSRKKTKSSSSVNP